MSFISKQHRHSPVYKKCAEQSQSAHRKMQTPIVVTQNFTKREFLHTFKQVGICIFANSTLEYTKGHNTPYNIKNLLYFIVKFYVTLI